MVKENRTGRWNTYESFYIDFSGKKVAEIHITHHAMQRWHERVSTTKMSLQKITEYIWECLQRSAVSLYYQGEEEVYIIDDDLVFVASFSEAFDAKDLIGNPLHRMKIITFLGKVSEDIELRDLKTYYSWLRHSRRMNLMKNSRTVR